jgi:hypothetical protein
MVMRSSGSMFLLSGISSISDPTTSSIGIFRYSPAAGFEVVAVSSPFAAGLPTAGGPGTVFSNFIDFNEAGDVVMQTDNGFGPIFVLEAGYPLTSVAPAGSSPKINDNGDVAHRIIIRPATDRLVVWNRNSVRIAASENAVAPGTGGALFSDLARQGTFENSDGSLTFFAGVAGAGVNESNDFGIWSENSPGSVQLELREGAAAADVGPGVVYAGLTRFTIPVTFGKRGGIALRAGLAGTGVADGNDLGLWAGPHASDLHLVAREGEQAPGTEPGTLFGQFDQAGVTTDGRAVFFALLTGVVDPSRDRGLWAEAPDGSLQLIARTGDMLELPSVGLSPLTSIQFSPEVGVGENGHVGFISGFSSGRFGIFVSGAVAVPEPARLLLIQALIMSIGLFFRRAPK